MLIDRDLSSECSLKVLILITQRVIRVSSFTASIPPDRTVIESLDEIALKRLIRILLQRGLTTIRATLWTPP